MLNKCLVLLATFNGEKYIKKQLESILNQKQIEVKIVVSDDMSSDLTIDIIKSFSDPRIEILPNIGKFGSASQNFFRLIRDVDFSNFEFVAFSDQDDVWNLDKLVFSIQKIQNYNCDVFSSNVIAFWDNGKELLLDKSQNQKKHDHFFGSAGPGCTYVMKNSLISDFKTQLLKHEKLSRKIDLHDWLIYTFARENNYRWHVDFKSTMRYRQHINNEFGANSGLKAVKSRWHNARNGWYRKQILLTARFCETNNNITKWLSSNSYFDRLCLFANIFNYKKKPVEALFLGITLIVPGFK